MDSLRTAAWPDMVNPILGWRWWLVDDDTLHSPYVGTPWPYEPTLAQCQAHPMIGETWDPTPVLLPNWGGEQCACGLRHEWLSVYDENGCLPRAYPTSIAKTMSLFPATEVRDMEYVPYDQWHHAPEETCRCGWYALYNPPPSKIRHDSLVAGRNLVLGAVGGWGRTVVYHEGWRSEYSAVLALVGKHNASIAHEYAALCIEDPQDLPRGLAQPLPKTLLP